MDKDLYIHHSQQVKGPKTDFCGTACLGYCRSPRLMRSFFSVKKKNSWEEATMSNESCGSWFVSLIALSNFAKI